MPCPVALPLSVSSIHVMVGCLSGPSLSWCWPSWPRSISVPAGALQIESSEETDQGKYECVATNSAGVRYSSPANLYVRGRELRQAEAGTHCPTLSHLITGLMVSWLPCPVQSRAGRP